MNKVELNRKIEEIAKEWFYMPLSEDANIPIEKIVNLCQPYLQKHPHDTDIWIKLALAVYTCPYSDEIKAIECVNAILSYDPFNPYALIILAYIESHMYGITDTTFNKLSFVDVDDDETMSMIEYVKSWYYSEKGDRTLYQKSLENSVGLWQQHVKNCIDLAWLYTEQGKIEDGEKLKALGLDNVKIRSNIHNIKYFNITDINHFLDERIKGTRITTDEEV